ncbi:MarR family winged helix-turn-helix transcriptional regulator [Microbacterium insulae]|uniref:MarR family winged helix-turn-helix transcriptional regulator n=1 Tax=Microbacterium insulae TaxID=483014 RepID=A0ABW3AFZ0_9MICO
MDAHSATSVHAPAAAESDRTGPPVRRATALLREILEVSEDFERHLGRELTVNPTDLQAMEHLLMSGPLGPSELSRRLGISTASTTKVVDRLVDLGHVTRQAHPTDRRGILVVPTESSRRRALSTLMPMIMGIDAELDAFSADEQSIITEYLERVVAVYRSHIGP